MSGPDAPTIIYVHGIGNKRRSEILRAEWDRALFGRDMGAASRMAYWADLRHPQPLPDSASESLALAEEELEAVVRDELPEQLEPPRAFVREVASEELPVDEPGAEPLRRLVARMTWRAEALAAGEEDRDARVGEEVLPLPRGWRTWLFRRFLKLFAADVHAYVGNLGPPIRARLQQALQGLTGPVVVVGHSLGSVIAYDVLYGLEGQLDVRLLVTIGSPLGVEEIQDVVNRPLRVPAPVRAWLNAADARDLVALDPTIRPEYPPESRCTDVLIQNDADPHHHGGSGYLSASQVQRPIRQLFGLA
jgi:hypothetical protein